MDHPGANPELRLDCPYCEGSVACRRADDLVICPHCRRRCRQISDYLDEATDDFIFALVPDESPPPA